MPTVHLLDYVAGNVRSLVNAIEKLDFTIEWITAPSDIEHAGVRIQISSSSIRFWAVSGSINDANI